MFEGLKNDPVPIKSPEFDLSVALGDYRLIGKFDLLLKFDEQFIIYDWKTARTQPKREWVLASLQSRVYPYLLSQAGSHLNNGNPIKPSNIKMIYWYANFPTSPLEIAFSENQLNKDQRYIHQLVDEISHLRETAYLMTDKIKRCQFCIYRSLCNRGGKAGSFDDIDNYEEQEHLELDLDFEQITEIEF